MLLDVVKCFLCVYIVKLYSVKFNEIPCKHCIQSYLKTPCKNRWGVHSKLIMLGVVQLKKKLLSGFKLPMVNCIVSLIGYSQRELDCSH